MKNRILLASASFALLEASASAAGLSPPRDVSEYGHRIDWLIDVTNVFCVILFVIMVVWMGLAFMKHGKAHTAEYDHGDAKKQVQKAALLSAIIFFIVDGNLWWNSTMDVNGIFWNFAKPQEGEHVKMEVNARQWIWQARYPGADGKFNTQDDALSDNDIRVPVNTPVVVQLASPDVIHTFTVPNLRAKQDATPGMVNTMWFQGKEQGRFEITCFQHCGANHYKMRGLLTVTSKEDFDRWVGLKGKDSQAVWEDSDTEAHWGWDWRPVK
jgi:cytochrome c oxidase subunit 2